MMNRDAIANAVAALAQYVETGDVIVIMPGSHALIKRGDFGALPCIGIANGALLLQCVKRVISARPSVVSLHFRQVQLRRRRDGGCFADLDGDIRAYAVVTPGRPVRVFVY